MPKSFLRRFTKKILIIANVFFALLFILGCYGGLLNPDRFWPVGYLILASFYILIILILLLIFWLIIKPRLAIISIISILLCFNPIQNIFQFNFSSSFVKQKQPESIRIMDWNVAQFDILNYKKNPSVKNQMIDLINDYQPDIACFQEMVAADTIVNLNTPYYQKNSFYPVSDFLNKLNFKNYFYSYTPLEDYLEQQHFGIIIFSKYPIVNTKTISHPPGDYNSIFQYADIVKEKDTFRLFNIHLQSLSFSPQNLKFLDNPEVENEQDVVESKSVLYKLKTGFLKRKSQSDWIKREMDKSPYPVMVCGDFNDVPNSYAYRTIGNGLQNTFTVKGSGLGRTFSGILPTLHIDNIFVGKNFEVQQFTRIPKILSDHYPIFSDVGIKK